jgi:hypothetical protein
MTTPSPSTRLAAFPGRFSLAFPETNSLRFEIADGDGTWKLNFVFAPQAARWRMGVDPVQRRKAWTKAAPALQAGFFFAQACVVGCCYVSGLAEPMPSGLDEIRELTPDYQGELGALRFSRALPTPVRPACHRVEDHPRSSWQVSSAAGRGLTRHSRIRPPHDRLRRGSASPRRSAPACWRPPPRPR